MSDLLLLAADETPYVEGDLDFALTRDLVVTSDLELMRQRIQVALRFFLGEWYLDTAHGVPYFDDILLKDPDVPAIRQILKDVILAVPDVIRVNNFEADYDNQARTFELSFRAITDYGLVEFEGSVP